MSELLVSVSVENYPPYSAQVVDAMSVCGADFQALMQRYQELYAMMEETGSIELQPYLDQIASLQGQITTLIASHQAAIAQLNEAHDQVLADLNASHQAAIAALEGQVSGLEGVIAQLNAEHAQAVADLNATHDLAVASLNSQISELEYSIDQMAIAFQSYLDQISGESQTDLADILSSKEMIRDAIIAKGVDVAEDATLGSYAARISEIDPPEPGYTSPADWPDISNVAANSIKIIFCDYTSLGVGFTVWATGQYQVDWGDGSTPTTHNSGSRAEHVYVKGAGAPCSRGYTTFVCTITSIGNITGFRNDRHSSVSVSGTVFPALGVALNTPYLETFNNAFEYFAIGAMLEFVEFIGSTPYLTSAGSACKSCISLRRFVFPLEAPLLSNIDSMFFYACNLREVVYPESLPSVTTLNMIHRANHSIKIVELPASMGSLASMNQAFVDCHSLEELTLPGNAPLLNDMRNFVQNCYRLRVINNIGISHADAQISYNDAFSNTRNLQDVVITDKVSAIAFNSSDGNMKSALRSIRLTNQGSLFGVNSTVNISRTLLNADALVRLFEDLPSLSGKTINISECAGTPFLTAEQRGIITAKGWTIIG